MDFSPGKIKVKKMYYELLPPTPDIQKQQQNKK